MSLVLFNQNPPQSQYFKNEVLPLLLTEQDQKLLEVKEKALSLLKSIKEGSNPKLIAQNQPLQNLHSEIKTQEPIQEQNISSPSFEVSEEELIFKEEIQNSIDLDSNFKWPNGPLNLTVRFNKAIDKGYLTKKDASNLAEAWEKNRSAFSKNLPEDSIVLELDFHYFTQNILLNSESLSNLLGERNTEHRLSFSVLKKILKKFPEGNLKEGRNEKYVIIQQDNGQKIIKLILEKKEKKILVLITMYQISHSKFRDDLKIKSDIVYEKKLKNLPTIILPDSAQVTLTPQKKREKKKVIETKEVKISESNLQFNIQEPVFLPILTEIEDLPKLSENSVTPTSPSKKNNKKVQQRKSLSSKTSNSFVDQEKQLSQVTPSLPSAPIHSVTIKKKKMKQIK